MGSSNKSRKHYKKDSRFVADLYTFTYDDDLDCVRDAKDEGRQRISGVTWTRSDINAGAN